MIPAVSLVVTVACECYVVVPALSPVQDFPIRDVQLVHEGKPHYTFIDRDLSVSGKPVYIVYTNRGRSPPITRIELVPEAEAASAVEARGLVRTGLVSVDGRVLMVQRGHGCPITHIDVFRGAHVMPKYVVACLLADVG